ncbi:MAG TPA: TonB-dependent receptor, partial [Vicinamibacterales bacterium]|nr:TonB-dependent receptor [Vicinamibacterales bacterium]
MKLLFRAAVAAALCFTTALGIAAAQTPLGSISGRTTDASRQPLSDVAVEVESANLQGLRRAVTSTSGEFFLPALPPGSYTVTFTAQDFQPRTAHIGVDPGQTSRLDVTLTSAPLKETIEIEGHIPLVSVTTGVQQATTFNQRLMSSLPTTRTLDAALSLAPNVHLTAPFAAPSISGAMAFESLFLVDGGVVNDTIRGQPLGLYIEDAVQETTLMTGGISAEYGRLTGGAVNLVTRSGGNRFGGSLRSTLTNDRWRTLTPFANDTRSSDVLTATEFTGGGPIVRDRLWFFGAGRAAGSDQARTALTVPYTFSERSFRYETKLTYAVAPSHSVSATATGIAQESKNIAFSTAIDVRSLYDRQVPQQLFSARYNGALTPRLGLEAGISARRLSIEHEGARTKDLIEGTLLIDRIRNRRYWSPTFCGICDFDRRNNNTAFAKLTSFVPTARGAHQLVAGYDMFNDIRAYDNHQSGSDFRILGTTAIIDGSNIYPVFAADGSTLIQYNPIDQGSRGTDFRVHSLYANDAWTLNPHWTFNLGLRWDKNHGKDASDQLVSTAASLSPRLGVAWDPTGSGSWTMTASASRYVDALASVIADSASTGGRSSSYQWEYRGRPINADPSERTTSDAAIREVFDWFNGQGGAAALRAVASEVPGVSVRVADHLESPSANEFAVGLSRAVGRRAVVRLDVMRRDFHNPYVARIDTSTGVVTDPFGRRFDLRLIENSDRLRRDYRAMTLSGTFHPGSWLEAGANYTLSTLWGNFEGEDTTGPIAALTLA